MLKPRSQEVGTTKSRRLVGRKCVLLGALAGSGPAIARALAADGCHVVVADSDGEQLLNLAASLNTSVPNSVDCCPIPELDKPYRNSELETLGQGADLLIDNREWAEYVTRLMLQNSAPAISAACDNGEPSIHLLSMTRADPEMNVLLSDASESSLKKRTPSK